MSDPCHCLAPSDACLLRAGSCLLTAALVSAEPAGAPQGTAPGMMVSQELGAWSKCSFLSAAALEGCAKHAEAPGLQCESCSAGCQAQTPSLSAVSLSSQTSQSTCRCGLLTPTASEAGYSDLDRMMLSLCAVASAAGGLDGRCCKARVFHGRSGGLPSTRHRSCLLQGKVHVF